jgi:hypothetical protein
MKERLISILLLFFFCSCKDDPPPGPGGEAQLQFAAIDASCTESWLAVKLAAGAQPRTLTLQRDTQTILATTLTASDTLIVDEGLLPNRQYTYTLTRPNGLFTDRLTAAITTMDTTSHNWVFDQPVLLGDGSSSVLYDVAIINDTLAYAVGEIYKRDSVGNWINPPFNIAKWNGRTWELSRRMYDCRLYYPNCGPGYFLYAPARSIFAFGPDDIWVAVGTAQHWDGVRWTEHAGIEGVGGAYKIWGTSSRDLYFVGYGGFIAHYDGVRWRRLESGTQVSLNDVWGGSNRIVGEDIALISGSDNFSLSERKILRVKNGDAVDSLTWGTIYRTPQSIWFDQRDVFVCGSTVWKLRRGGAWEELIAPSFFLNSIRGTASNDLVMVGHFGIVMHFNGWSFRSFEETRLATGYYSSVTATMSTMIAVGRTGSKAVVLVGRR